MTGAPRKERDGDYVAANDGNGYHVFFVRRATPDVWQRIATFSNEERADDYAELENDLSDPNEWDDPHRYDAKAPLPELPPVPPSRVSPEYLRPATPAERARVGAELLSDAAAGAGAALRIEVGAAAARPEPAAEVAPQAAPVASPPDPAVLISSTTNDAAKINTGEPDAKRDADFSLSDPRPAPTRPTGTKEPPWAEIVPTCESCGKPRSIGSGKLCRACCENQAAERGAAPPARPELTDLDRAIIGAVAQLRRAGKQAKGPDVAPLIDASVGEVAASAARLVNSMALLTDRHGLAVPGEEYPPVAPQPKPLTPNQERTLAALQGLGARKVRMHALADMAKVPRGSITQAVYDLERKGLIAAGRAWLNTDHPGARPTQVRAAPPALQADGLAVGTVFAPPPLDGASPAELTRPVDDEAAQIARHIAERGVTRTIDWGVHGPIVEAARSCAYDVARTPKRAGGKSWLLNGAPCDTAEFYRRVNKELTARGRKEIRVPSEAAA